MDLVHFVVEEHLKDKRPIPELARAYGIDKSWLYKRLKRYRLTGELGSRSRRPKRSPGRVGALYEDEIVELRKELSDLGVDAGAATIHTHMSRRHEAVPSVSTIWRVLKARGFVVPEPHKRPKSSYRRFVADLPNERWQIDATHWSLSDGTSVEILNVIDDHSRLCVSSHVFLSVHARDVVHTLHKAATSWGYPASVLSDNGPVFSSVGRGGEVAMEAELWALGIETKHARPHHPETCGKVERFHQTEKKYLERQASPETKKQLQGQLNRFVAYYNEIRPHRAIGRKTPLEVFNARARATPHGPKIDTAGYRVLRSKVDRWGRVTIRVRAKLHHVGIGNRFAGTRVFMLVAGRDVRVLTPDGQPLRHFILDTEHDYQRIP